MSEPDTRNSQQEWFWQCVLRHFGVVDVDGPHVAFGQDIAQHFEVEVATLRRERDRYQATLEDIARNDEECGCTHDTDDCCNAQGVFCAHCLADVALAAVPAPAGTEAE